MGKCSPDFAASYSRYPFSFSWSPPVFFSVSILLAEI